MTEVSVKQFNALINKQIQASERLGEYVLQVEALAYVAAEDSFLHYPLLIQSHYLWVLKELIKQIKLTNEHALNHLLQELSAN